jgi:hypothetical protein
MLWKRAIESNEVNVSLFNKTVTHVSVWKRIGEVVVRSV